MTVSVIVPLRNGLSFTRHMFASLMATWPKGVELEVVFVDNGSTDGTLEWLDSLENTRVRVIRNEENAGYAAANNQGAAAASGELLVLLNNDVMLLPGWLGPMIETHEESQASIVGNVQISTRTRNTDHAGIFFDSNGNPIHFRPTADYLRRQRYLDVPAVTGACVLVNKNWFIDVGGFDEGYRNGYEDVDLCMRARSGGQTIAVSMRSWVFHYTCASEGRHEFENENARRFREKWLQYAHRLFTLYSLPAVATITFDTFDNAFDRDHFAVLQVFDSCVNGHSEEMSSRIPYRTRQWVRVTASGPLIDKTSEMLRIDLCDFPAVIKIAAIGWRETKSTKLIGLKRGRALENYLSVKGTAELRRETGRVVTVVSTGNDPQLWLHSSAIPTNMRNHRDFDLELLLRTDPDV